MGGRRKVEVNKSTRKNGYANGVKTKREKQDGSAHKLGIKGLVFSISTLNCGGLLDGGDGSPNDDEERGNTESGEEECGAGFNVLGDDILNDEASRGDEVRSDLVIVGEPEGESNRLDDLLRAKRASKVRDDSVKVISGLEVDRRHGRGSLLGLDAVVLEVSRSSISSKRSRENVGSSNLVLAVLGSHGTGESEGSGPLAVEHEAGGGKGLGVLDVGDREASSEGLERGNVRRRGEFTTSIKGKVCMG